jgi:uncharacterized coiled-coil protein SlyX
MSKIIPGPWSTGTSGGGDGPEMPMLEQRVAALESKLDRMDSTIQRIDVSIAKIEATLGQMPKMADFAALKSDVAETKGRLGGLPSTWQLLLSVIATWASGAAIVFTILKFGAK